MGISQCSTPGCGTVAKYHVWIRSLSSGKSVMKSMCSSCYINLHLPVAETHPSKAFSIRTLERVGQQGTDGWSGWTGATELELCSVCFQQVNLSQGTRSLL